MLKENQNMIGEKNLLAQLDAQEKKLKERKIEKFKPNIIADDKTSYS